MIENKVLFSSTVKVYSRNKNVLNVFNKNICQNIIALFFINPKVLKFCSEVFMIDILRVKRTRFESNSYDTNLNISNLFLILWSQSDWKNEVNRHLKIYHEQSLKRSPTNSRSITSCELDAKNNMALNSRLAIGQ